MKLIRIHEDDLDENYLELHYDELNDAEKKLLAKLSTSPKTEGYKDGQMFMISIKSILYCEVVDRKTFCYTSNDTYEIKMSLQDLLDNYAEYGFVRISKSMILSVYHVDNLKGDVNMRVKVTMDNSEQLIVNRGYRNEFYDQIKQMV